ncbi:unnamed protein product [Closterium sp. NIES-65]|nr:unnamed protein product [Closterium sp. NIES-65]
MGRAAARVVARRAASLVHRHVAGRDGAALEAAAAAVGAGGRLGVRVGVDASSTTVVATAVATATAAETAAVAAGGGRVGAACALGSRPACCDARLAGATLVGSTMTAGVLLSTQDPQTISKWSFAAADALTPFLRLLDPEAAHRLALLSAELSLVPHEHRPDPPALCIALWNRAFPNPVGLAAGFDKDGRAVDGLLGMGFGFMEIGSVTPAPQPGNPKPRVWRIPEQKAVINRYGFNSEGIAAVAERLGAQQGRRRAVEKPEGLKTGKDRAAAPPAAGGNAGRRGLVGVNLGKNKWTDDAAEDFVQGMHTLAQYADFLVVNVSSPNTPGLRKLQGRRHLHGLLTKVLAAREEMQWGEEGPPPLLLKISPDLSHQDMADIAAVSSETLIPGPHDMAHPKLDLPAPHRTSHSRTWPALPLSVAAASPLTFRLPLPPSPSLFPFPLPPSPFPLPFPLPFSFLFHAALSLSPPACNSFVSTPDPFLLLACPPDPFTRGSLSQARRPGAPISNPSLHARLVSPSSHPTPLNPPSLPPTFSPSHLLSLPPSLPPTFSPSHLLSLPPSLPPTFSPSHLPRLFSPQLYSPSPLPLQFPHPNRASHLHSPAHSPTAWGEQILGNTTIVGNTTVSRPDSVLGLLHADEPGGLSGRPLFDPSTNTLREMYRLTKGRITLIGCGGIFSGADAYTKIRAGASLVQIYTAMVYEGAGVLPRIKRELAECLARDGFESVEDAVGADHRAAAALHMHA